MPVLTAAGAGVRHRRRWIFRDLDVSAEPGELVAVAGAPGSGRTTVLLALAGRLRLSAGKIKLSGTAALGYVPDVEQPEPVLTVAEHVHERLALLGRPAREAATVLAGGLYGLDPALQGRQLTPYQKQLLGLVLARLADPAVIALDGIDAGLDAAEQRELWRILGELSGTGVAVFVTVRDVEPDRVTTVIRLSDPQAPAADETHARDTASEPQTPTEIDEKNPQTEREAVARSDEAAGPAGEREVARQSEEPADKAGEHDVAGQSEEPASATVGAVERKQR